MILFHISKWLKIIPESIQCVNSVCLSPHALPCSLLSTLSQGLTTELSPALRTPPTPSSATAAQKGLLTADCLARGYPGDCMCIDTVPMAPQWPSAGQTHQWQRSHHRSSDQSELSSSILSCKTTSRTSSPCLVPQMTSL